MLLSSRPFQRGSAWICKSCIARFATSATRKHSNSPNSQISRLPSKPARTRFAPSPTGYLHLGSLRTALFNYLLAKRTGGQFLLRIEDTDQKRTIPGAEQRLCEDLKWAGLQWDEGPEVGGPYGPYRQSERTPLYQEHAQKLIKSGHAYRCFCPSERLHALARQRNKLGLPTDYDRTCASIPAGESEDRAAKGESHVIRLKVPDKYPDMVDLVYGKVRNTKAVAPFKHGELSFEDPVLLKSDGLPTYHLANVVDDHHMKITHVIRAAEWISSTPKHLYMYHAFDWAPPEFAHVGLLQDENGHKLSKRNFDLDISAFRDTWGIFPEALANYAALLGWSHNQKTDFLPMDQLIKNFDLKFTKGNTIVTFGKLWYLQKEYARLYANKNTPEFEATVDKITNVVRNHAGISETEELLNGRDLREYVAAIFRADAKNYTSPEDFLDRNDRFFHPVINVRYEPLESFSKDPLPPPPPTNLASAADKICQLGPESWNVPDLKAKMSAIVEEGSRISAEDVSGEMTKEVQALRRRQKAWNRAFYHYMRWALLEGKQGPDAASVMVILGRDITLERLSKASNLVRASQRSNNEAVAAGTQA
ncbi:glutamyl-tRNA synthetase [Xylona heveae TC161]|uniref:Glutamate--tRNA ligase, mitochondrial n=1 Tax=Xylona heveae (strain CBS 132557 / TC161) TaxID=1328760 RepID=A0A165JSA3_XYLHT|nr:glutamyl-tRNA synthetase [Xylona heveae TC161]KZF26564.1 glutamyl-tRNA synthetase [Xylona heveae TC161]